jgi:hypothetical protein
VTSIKTGRTVEDLKAKGGRVWSKGGERAPMTKAPKWGFVEPALCTPIETPPDGDKWIHEIKYDGYRMQAAVSGDAVRLYTRTGLDWTSKFSHVANALRELGLKDVLLDGEVAVADASGHTSFSSLQRSLENGDAKGVSYFVFDLIAEGDKDLRKMPLLERKARLEKQLGGACAPIRLSPYVEGDGPHVLEAFAEKGLEGVVSAARNHGSRPNASTNASSLSSATSHRSKAVNSRRLCWRSARTESSPIAATWARVSMTRRSRLWPHSLKNSCVRSPRSQYRARPRAAPNGWNRNSSCKLNMRISRPMAPCGTLCFSDCAATKAPMM